MTVQTLLKSI